MHQTVYAFHQDSLIDHGREESDKRLYFSRAAPVRQSRYHRAFLQQKNYLYLKPYHNTLLSPLYIAKPVPIKIAYIELVG